MVGRTVVVVGWASEWVIGRASRPDRSAKIRRLSPIILVLAFLALFLEPRTTQAGPIFITRGLLIHPLYKPSEADSGGFFTRNAIWGGIQKGFGSEGERFGWLLDVGAVIELWQWESSSLLAISGMQLNADPHNEISFNPTGVTWEEHLVYATRGEGTNWQLGFAQRCRHDVDNLDIKEATGEAQQRTLIYSSITGKMIPKHFTQYGIGVDLWLHGDIYVIGQDYRLPKHTSTAQPNVERLAASTGLNFELTFSDRSGSGFYFNLATTFSMYGNESGLFRKFATINSLDMDQRGELGYRIPGRGGNFRIFVGAERLSDDGIMPIPERNQYFFLGFRFSGKDLLL